MAPRGPRGKRAQGATKPGELEQLQRRAFDLLLRAPTPLAVAEELLAQICATLRTDCGNVCRYDEASDTLSRLASHGSPGPGDPAGPPCCPAGSPLVLRLRALETIRVEDAAAEGTPEASHMVSYGVRAGLIMPVPLATSLWGAVGVEMVAEPRAWSIEETMALHAIAEAFGRAVERQQAAERLERESAKLSGMLSGMDEGVVFADESGRCIEVNPYFCRFFGVTRDEVLAMDLRDIHRGDTGRKLVEGIERFRATPGAQPVLVQRKLRGVDVLMRLQPMYVGDRYSGLLLNVIPVTELAEARRAAERANEAKSRFLANVSHEIRTPLNTIIGFADLLRAERLTAEQLEMATAVRNAGRALLDVINDILDLSRAEADRIHIEKLRFRPGELVSEVVTGLRPQADSKRIGLVWTVDGSVPETLVGDRHRLRQILTNLVGNAVKFTERGDVAVLLSGEREAAGYRLRVRVKDTGIGIPAERQEAIFQPFSQADSSIARRYGGTGLGLAICKHLATLMSGRIEVASSVGRGSTFTVHLLLELPPAADGPAAGAPAEADGPPARGPARRRRVLVAEDNEANRKIAVKMLDGLGYDVAAVENGQEVLDLLRQDPAWDLVFMDLQMPVLDGLEATRRLRQDPRTRGLPVIAITASTTQEDRERCLEAGVTDYLVKPVDWPAANRWLQLRLWGQPSGGPSADAAAPLASTPVFDRVQALAKLCGDEDLLRQVIGVFLANADAYLADVRAAVEGGDGAAAAAAVHKLKGGAASVGAARVVAAAQELERAARGGQLAPARALLGLLGEELRGFRLAASA